VAPSLWGGFSQYLYLPPNAILHKIPAHVPATQAALFVPLANGMQWAYLQGGAAPGKTVVIQGPGQMGLASVVAAREAGSPCIIVSGLTKDEKRFEVAREDADGLVRPGRAEGERAEAIGEVAQVAVKESKVDYSGNCGNMC